MELKKLQKHVRTLITLEETDDLVISCYLNLEFGESGYRNFLTERVRVLNKSLTGEVVQSFKEALSRIELFIKTELLPDTKGVAVFARGGAQPFFLPLQFRVPLPNWVAVNSTPNIYHLVELKDTYHRFMVMLSTEESARIFGINLGSVTEQLWVEMPELRNRVGREWTKQHYQRHQRERREKFIKEKIKVLDKLMSEGGYTHLILAGSPQATARVRKLLPKHIEDKLIDVVTASGKDKIGDVVSTTVSAFIEQEEIESQSMVEELERMI